MPNAPLSVPSTGSNWLKQFFAGDIAQDGLAFSTLNWVELVETSGACRGRSGISAFSTLNWVELVETDLLAAGLSWKKAFSTLNWVELVETGGSPAPDAPDAGFQYPQLGRIG